MFDLEAQIKEWRAELSRTGIAREVVDELEGHLRERVDRLKASGCPEPEVFQTAMQQLGDGKTLKKEFAKLKRGPWRIFRAIRSESGSAGGLVCVYGIEFPDQAIDRIMRSPFPVWAARSRKLFIQGCRANPARRVCHVCARNRNARRMDNDRSRFAQALENLFLDSPMVCPACDLFQDLLRCFGSPVFVAIRSSSSCRCHSA